MAGPKVAVIGLGMGRGHARAAAENPKAELAALCDIDEEKLSRNRDELDCLKVYTDYKDMLAAEELDIVSVSLPNYLHKSVTIDALRAGAHVICEKPMAMNTAEAEEMKQVAEETGKHLMINFSYRFTGAAKALKRVAEAGTLGQVYFVRTGWTRARGIPKFGGWFAQKDLSGGGPLIDLGVHRIDLALMLMGDPKPVTISASTYDHIGTRMAKEQNKPFDVEDLAVAFIRFDNGATMHVETSWTLNSQRPSEKFTYVYGTKAGICHRQGPEGYEAYISGEWEGTYVTSQIQEIPRSENSMDHFIDVVADGVEPTITAENGVNVMKILDGAYESARLGREIEV